jgi:flagellar biosynthetic protein FliO
MPVLKLLKTLLLVITAVIILGCFSSINAQGNQSNSAAKPAISGNEKSGDLDFLSTMDTAVEEEKQVDNTPWYVTALSFIGKFVLVIALIYITIFLLKKFSSIKPTVGGSNLHVRVLENTALAPNRSLHVVQIGGKTLLISSTPSQVSLISELNSEDVPKTDGEIIQPAGFKDQLSMFLGSKQPGSDSAKSVSQMLRESTGFLQDKVREVSTVRGKIRSSEIK